MNVTGVLVRVPVAPLWLDRPDDGCALDLIVPGKPVSDNRLYLIGRGRSPGGKRLSPAALAWKAEIAAAVHTWRVTNHLRIGCADSWPLPWRVVVTLIGVTGDAPNYLKCTLDGLKVALGVDDAHYRPVVADLRPAGTCGVASGALIEIWPALAPSGLPGAVIVGGVGDGSRSGTHGRGGRAAL